MIRTDTHYTNLACNLCCMLESEDLHPYQSDLSAPTGCLDVELLELLSVVDEYKRERCEGGDKLLSRLADLAKDMQGYTERDEMCASNREVTTKIGELLTYT